ncbi:MAG: hypothetical protein Q9184_002838 [Pyrenodesmia sp. 2 TL-2023]
MASAIQRASQLFVQIAKSLRHRHSAFRQRTDIVSPHLCDEALQRLAPSLQAYKGCTVIDINPGIGLWSSKIHKIIQPGRHLLVEPPNSPFVPQLKTLVERQDSRYQLLNWEDKYVWDPDRYISEDLLPALEASESQEPNHSILVLANAAMSPNKTRMRKTGARSHLMLMDWMHDLRRRSGFHAGGPVRMLLWCPAKETTGILPRTILYRSKLSISLETACHVEEIVGSDETARGKQRKRNQNVELMSERQVLERMRVSGIALPAGRETEIYKQVQEEDTHPRKDEVGDEAVGPQLRTRGWHQELQDLQLRFAAHEFAKAHGMLPGDKGIKPRGAKSTPEYLRMKELERNIRHIQKRTDTTEQFLQEYFEVDRLYAQAQDLPLDDPQRRPLLQEIQARKENLQARVDSNQSPHVREEYVNFKHDRKAFRQDPPLLMWDQRRADPLRAYDEEFYPETSLCLLDVEPKHPHPFSLSQEEGNLFATLLAILWHNPKDNLTALDQIAPGAFEALVPKVPALSDPSRGGEWDVRELPMNRLTPEMVYGLTKAWIDWPFKPDAAALLRRGRAFDEDEAIPDINMRQKR